MASTTITTVIDSIATLTVTEQPTNSSKTEVTKNQFGPCPIDTHNLHVLVHSQEEQPKCDCDICDVVAFARSRTCPPWCCSATRLLRRSPTPNRYGNTAYKPLSLPHPSEEMQVVRLMIEYFDHEQDHLNETQLQAVDALRLWISHRAHEFLVTDMTREELIRGRRSEKKTYASLVSPAELESLWTWINNIFFGERMEGVSIGWMEGPPDDERTQGRTEAFYLCACEGNCGCISKTPPKVKMTLNPVFIEPDSCMTSMMSLISCILHESAHACLDYHVQDDNLHIGGHGRPWQTLAERIEEVFFHLTGLPIMLGRLEAIQEHWETVDKLPTLHDLAAWNLEREEVYHVHNYNAPRHTPMKPERDHDGDGPPRFRIRSVWDSWRKLELKRLRQSWYRELLRRLAKIGVDEAMYKHRMSNCITQRSVSKLIYIAIKRSPLPTHTRLSG
jgi:hypothetical protein